MTYEKLIYAAFTLLVGALSTTALATEDATSSQILVTVGNRQISSFDLERVVNSSPVATQFNVMDEVEQAEIRGRMLKNLIYSEMLYQEGLRQQIDQRQSVKSEIENYRRGLLYRQYLSSLHPLAAGSSAERAAIKQRLKGEANALAATRAASQSARFADVKKRRLLDLGKLEHLEVFTAPLSASPRDPDARLAKGDQLEIHLNDLVYGEEDLQEIDGEILLQRLDAQVEYQLIVHAAEQAGFDVSAPLSAFRRDLIRQIVMQEKEQAWVPDRAALRDYYQSHPELSRVAEQWQVGQIVVATREEAEALRQRILDGESLYSLAAEYSIDPYGRKHAGDMGWVRPDQAPVALRDAAADLPIGKISPVVETRKGFHILIVEARKPSYQKPLNEVAGGIRRTLILDRLAQDYVELSERYPIHWRLPEHRKKDAQKSKPTITREREQEGATYPSSTFNGYGKAIG